MSGDLAVIFFKCGSDERRWQTLIILFYDERPIISSGIVLGPCARSNINIIIRIRVRLPRPENTHNAFIRGGWRSPVGRSNQNIYTKSEDLVVCVTIMIYDVYKYIIQYIIRSDRCTVQNIRSHHRHRHWLQIIGLWAGKLGGLTFLPIIKIRYGQALRPSTNSVYAPKNVRY